MTEFKSFESADYQDVCNFFIAMNEESRIHINWNWARWEWMYVHPNLDREALDTIGLWKSDGRVVALATYDERYGEGFCGTLKTFEGLLPEIISYAEDNLYDENGWTMAANDSDESTIRLLADRGFSKVEQTETIMRIPLENELNYSLPAGCAIREVLLPQDIFDYRLLFWKGFDHGDDIAEFEENYSGEFMMPPHANPQLCLSVTDDGKRFLSHCTCWYDKSTDYVYIEPVCTIPEARGKGMAKAVIYECLNRCRALGAKQAYVISNQKFYEKLGFEKLIHYSFFNKK